MQRSWIGLYTIRLWTNENREHFLFNIVLCFVLHPTPIPLTAQIKGRNKKKSRKKYKFKISMQRSPASIPRTPIRTNRANLSFMSTAQSDCAQCIDLQNQLKLLKLRAESAFCELREQLESETATLQSRLQTKETAMLLEQKTLMDEISRLQIQLVRQENVESEISARDELIRSLRLKTSGALEISDLQGQVASLAQINSALTSEISSRTSELSTLRQTHADTEAALMRLSEIAKHSMRESGISRARNDLSKRKEVSEVERKLHALEISCARLKIQYQAVANNLADVQNEAQRVVRGKDAEIAELRRLMDIERDEIRRLGVSNLNDRLFFEKMLRGGMVEQDVSPVNREPSTPGRGL